ncbi:MAG TPA: hypothetical protein VEH04_11060 [Verrucomicrobiae bacterium]|nr:hypothetical protein [Verrucomicrobiae bacterium]
MKSSRFMLLPACMFCLAGQAQPANDRCDGAAAMTLNVAYSQNTLLATSAGDPSNVCTGPFGKGVWYSMQPPQYGTVTISSCGSDFNTAIEVYSSAGGNCDTKVFRTCGDNVGPACDSDQASVSFEGFPSVKYFIVVGGRGGIGREFEVGRDNGHSPERPVQ